MRRIAAALIASLGCGSTGSPPARRDGVGAASRFVASPVYASLFRRGESLSFAGRAGREDAREHIVSDAPLAFRCRVGGVRGGRDFAVAELSCEADGEWLGGLLGATAAGLFRLRRPAASAAAVQSGQLLLPAAPSPRSSRSEGRGCSRGSEVFREAELWCASESTECDDGRPDPLRCYAAAQDGRPDPRCADLPPRGLASTICFAGGTIAVASRREVGVGSVRVTLSPGAATGRSLDRASPPPGAPPRARGGG